MQLKASIAKHLMKIPSWLLFPCLVTAVIAEVPSPVVVTATKFGARGDGIHDDTAALRRLLTRLPRKTEVTIDLGSGTYLVQGDQSDPACGNYILGLGVTTDLPATLHLTGQGARIIANEKTSAHLLAIIAKFTDLTVQGITFERQEVTTAQDSNFQGGPGIYLTDASPQHAVAEVSFKNCSFINCHRSLTALSRFKDLNDDDHNPFFLSGGKLNKLAFINCSFLYPYGSNSTFSDGGGQGLACGPWVNTTALTDCRFDGAMGSLASVPNHLAVDGLFIGDTLNLIVQKCHLRHFRMEGIFKTAQGGFAHVTSAFTMPQVRGAKGAKPAIIQTDGSCQFLRKGQRVWYPHAGFLFVHKPISPTSVEVYSTGEANNAPPGTAIAAEGFLAVRMHTPGTSAIIEDNFIDGSVIPKAPTMQCGDPGVRIDYKHAELRGNTITAKSGISLVDPTFTGFKSQRDLGGIIADNTIKLINNSEPYRGEPFGKVCGISSYEKGTRIARNSVIFAANKCGQAIAIWGEKAVVENNTIFAQTVISGTDPSIGVFVGNMGQLAPGLAPLIQGNSFKNLDIGIGTSTNQSNSLVIGPGNTFNQVATPVQPNSSAITLPSPSASPDQGGGRTIPTTQKLPAT